MDSAPLNLCTTANSYSHEHALHVALSERKDNVLNERLDKILDERTQHQYSISPIRQLLVDSSNGLKGYDHLLFLTASSTAGTQTRGLIQELAVLHTHLWKNGRTLKVKFLGGATDVQTQIAAIAKEWEQYANITFDFIQQGDADIRIGFARDGSWSMIGTVALTVADQSKSTMNFDLNDTTMDENHLRSTVLHEFGHCLGCVHEHQHPNAAIQWDRSYIYRALMFAYGWFKDKVDQNFFSQLPPDEISNSTYDKHSIMHYHFPPEFTLNRLILPQNMELSAQDIAFIGECYPFPSKTSASLLHS
jgi:hypothetical protein